LSDFVIVTSVVERAVGGDEEVDIDPVFFSDSWLAGSSPSEVVVESAASASSLLGEIGPGSKGWLPGTISGIRVDESAIAVHDEGWKFTHYAGVF
jgi:hypothetical protein